MWCCFCVFNCTNTKGNRLHFFYHPRVILSWLPKRAELAVRYNNLVRALDFIKQFCCCLGIFLFSILLKLYQKTSVINEDSTLCLRLFNEEICFPDQSITADRA